MNHPNYPKCKFHADGTVRTVKSAEEESRLGEGWYDAPIEAPPAEPDAFPVADGCACCAALKQELSERTAKFDSAYAHVLEENEALRAKKKK